MLLFALLSLLATSAAGREALEAQIRTIAATAGGTVGVSVLHLESGRGASLAAGERFPMASVFKLPVAIELLRRVDRGVVRLDQRVLLVAGDMRAGGPIAASAPAGGITVTVGELLEAMLVDSDNTAADKLLPMAGGPEIITAQLEEAGLSGIRVDRSEAEVLLDLSGVTNPPPRAAWSIGALRKARDGVSETARLAAFERFLADPRDTATPDALVQLLRFVHEGRRLTPESRDRLLALMTRTRTGAKRLRSLLPAGTPVADRTGTCLDFADRNACINDIGIVTLPGNAGHLAIAVLIRGSDKDLAARERAIARIGRAAYDHWRYR